MLPASEELLELEGDEWEGEILWEGRRHVRVSFLSHGPPNDHHREAINEALGRLSGLDRSARTMLGSAQHPRLPRDGEFRLFGFDLGDRQQLAQGDCRLSYSRPSDEDGIYTVHFQNWEPDSAVRDD